MILNDENITIPKSGPNGPVESIEQIVYKGSYTIWKKGFSEHIGPRGKFTKTKEFASQPDTVKAARRAVVRYFNLELLEKKVIEKKDIPARFDKWLDTSSSDCIFNDSQRSNFTRPHLLLCAWYVELNSGERCSDAEKALMARCDREAQELEAAGLEVAIGPMVDDMSEKDRKKFLARKAREEAREKDKEDRALKRDQAKRVKAEEKALNAAHAKVVKMKGLRKAAEESGISPSASSKPSDSLPQTSVPTQSLYSIKTIHPDDVASDVGVINDSVEAILAQYEELDGTSKPASWVKITKFVSEHQGHKRREHKGNSDSPAVVDLLIMDVPEGLPVPGISLGKDIPLWNQLKLRTSGSGKLDSSWINAAFNFADDWVSDDGAVLVFFPDSKFITNEISSWALWANFREEMKWVVSTGLPLTKPDYPNRTVKYFMAKLFVRKENPDDSIPNSSFRFNRQDELRSQGFDLPNDGWLSNSISFETLTMRDGSSHPWRGAREKSENLLLALVDLCTEEDDIIMDISASTGTFLPSVWLTLRYLPNLLKRHFVSVFSLTRILHIQISQEHLSRLALSYLDTSSLWSQSTSSTKRSCCR